MDQLHWKEYTPHLLERQERQMVNRQISFCQLVCRGDRIETNRAVLDGVGGLAEAASRAPAGNVPARQCGKKRKETKAHVLLITYRKVLGSRKEDWYQKGADSGFVLLEMLDDLLGLRIGLRQRES